MKKCIDCPALLPQEQFSRVTAKGRVYSQPRCSECQRRYHREYYQKEKRRLQGIRKARRQGDKQAVDELLKRNQAAREREALGERKKCSRCARLGRESVHPKTAFARSSNSVDGYQPWCMRCIIDANSEKRKQRKERRTLFLITRPGADPSEPPVEGARQALYPLANGEMQDGWFLRFPKVGELERFLSQHAPATVQPARGNPEFSEIILPG